VIAKIAQLGEPANDGRRIHRILEQVARIKDIVVRAKIPVED
jgi:hypothetical protein